MNSGSSLIIMSMIICLGMPNLADLVREIEKEENIDFFGAAEFEEALMKFFNSL